VSELDTVLKEGRSSTRAGGSVAEWQPEHSVRAHAVDTPPADSLGMPDGVLLDGGRRRVEIAHVLRMQNLLGNYTVSRMIATARTRSAPLGPPVPLLTAIQRAEPTPRAQTGGDNAWGSLSDDAREVLEMSFLTRESRPDVLWKTAKTVEEGYNSPMSAWWRDPFVNVYRALHQAGLWIHVEVVVHVIPEHVQGIRFKAELGDSLAVHLSNSPDYCKAGSDWRQMVPLGTAGLHVKKYSPGVWEAHIDTVSPVKKRTSDGECSYDSQTGLKHWGTDLFGHGKRSR
jgi:hypothetical protein